MSTPTKSKAQIVAVKDYPAMLTEEAAAEFTRTFANPETKQRASRVIEQRREVLSSAVRDYIKVLEKAMDKGDMKPVYAQSHEIRGLAANAGLEAVGRIADGLCKYIDAAQSLDAPLEKPVVALHIDAICRAASAVQDAKTHGARVATELGVLVARKLQAINDLKTKSA